MSDHAPTAAELEANTAVMLSLYASATPVLRDRIWDVIELGLAAHPDSAAHLFCTAARHAILDWAGRQPRRYEL